MKNYLSGLFILLTVFIYVPYTYTYEKPIPVEKEITPIDSWISDLARYECDGCGPHYRRIDSNGKYSYSCLQFQEATFREMVGLYDPKLPTEQFWILIYDCSYQKQLAYELITDRGVKAARHWQTSVDRGLGLPPVNY